MDRVLVARNRIAIALAIGVRVEAHEADELAGLLLVAADRVVDLIGGQRLGLLQALIELFLLVDVLCERERLRGAAVDLVGAPCIANGVGAEPAGAISAWSD